MQMLECSTESGEFKWRRFSLSFDSLDLGADGDRERRVHPNGLHYRAFFFTKIVAAWSIFNNHCFDRFCGLIFIRWEAASLSAWFLWLRLQRCMRAELPMCKRSVAAATKMPQCR